MTRRGVVSDRHACRPWARSPGFATVAITMLAAVASGACGEEAGTPLWVTVVDSAGVPIVTNGPGSIEAAEAWTLSREPVVDVGSDATPGVALFRVATVVPLGGDRFAVATNSPSRVSFLEGDGTRVAVLGRDGQGPGEFSGELASVVPLGGDSMGGDSMSAASSAEMAAWTHVLPSADGSLVLFGVGGFGPGEGVRRVEAPSRRIDREGEVLATYGPFLDDWTSFVDEWLAPLSEGERTAIAGILDRIPRPERFPAYDGLIAADTGEIWVGAYPGQLTMPGTPRDARVPERRWLVFGADGSLVATVHTPVGFQPRAVREGRVWGVFRDELDVESVRAYAVATP